VVFLFLAIFLGWYSAKAKAVETIKIDTSIVCDTVLKRDSSTSSVFSNNADVLRISHPDSIPSSKFKTKKIIAAILSFPVPFGLLGLHRIFLGTKPYIPFVYVGTVGGCFLVLPIIDFIAILSADEEVFKQYENNPKVFMWLH
jgi:TM2 domain-containing membrane protein YozV